MILDDSNDFWDELCGTNLAIELGITEINKESLEKFDTEYMNYYSYLVNYIETIHVENKKVLDIGLGFGTVSQKLFLEAKEYTGLDFAKNPVEMIKKREIFLYNIAKVIGLDCYIIAKK